MHAAASGVATAPYRPMANNIFAVVQGEGASTVDGRAVRMGGAAM